MTRRVGGALAVAVLTLLSIASPAVAKTSYPAFTAPVVDAAGVVPDDIEQQVDAGLNDYQRRSGNQIGVAVIKTVGNASLENYSIDLARRWGLGKSGKDNGVLLFIAYDDHKLRIEVGRGLEGTLTDLDSGRIIRERMVPRLQANDVGGAVVDGTNAIRKVLGDDQVGELPPAPRTIPTSRPTGSSYGGLIFLFSLAFFGLGFIGHRRRRLWGLPIFWGGGFGGGGWGGATHGFGGGFGGGGASGGW